MIDAAVRSNAEWCDLVCREHGLAPVFDGDVWWCAERTPPFYPDAMTLARGVSADAVLAHVDLSPGCSIKDSYADLVLDGFDVLFEAQWIVLDGDAAGDVIGLFGSGRDYEAAVAAARHTHGSVPLVGYDHGDGLDAALAAGFRPLGPLRVWMRER